jgi:single-strand DNA-binding protein
MLIELVTLGRDSELRYTQSGTPVLGFAAAYNVGFGDNKKTQWLDCAIFGKSAEGLASHLIKGKQIQIVAKDVCIDEYPKKDGGTGFKLKCTVVDVSFCNSGQSAQQNRGGQGGYAQQSAPVQQPAYSKAPQQPQQQPQPQQPQQRPEPPAMDSFEDDIPF